MSIELSIVSPIYNEEPGILKFLELITKALSELDRKYLYELVLVDDGSKDETWKKIQEFIQSQVLPTNLKVHAVRLATNYGQMSALDAGLRAAKGSYVLTMDCDLQHPPEYVEEFFNCRLLAPVVVGIQAQRHESSMKSYLSRKFYKLLELISGIPVIQNGGDFRLIQRNILDQLLLISDNQSVMRFAIIKLGLPTHKIEFNSQPRTTGTSKYNIRKMLKLAISSILTLTTRPLRLSIFFTIAFALVSIVEIFYILYSYTINNTVPGWASIGLLVSVGFLTVSFSSMIQALYISRIYESSQNYPRFIITDDYSA
jgi:glycosyltransferase involved in cell wall biosynthesis